MTSGTLLSIHNITFLITVAQKCRQAIIDGTFRELFEQFQDHRQESITILP
jgi:tRNA-guanine family transglycosylase